MKKLLFLPLLVMMAFVVSCSSDDDNNMPDVDNRVFTGKLLLNGSPITDGTMCELNVVEGTAAITLYGVQFAPAMPAMDITIPMLNCRKSSDGYEISGKDVLPMVGDKPMDDFLISSVEASLTGDKFVVSAETELGTIGFSNAIINIKPNGGSAKNYKGSLVVGDFAKEDVVISVTKNGNAVDVLLNDVKFAANMPLVLDITLKALPCTVDGANLSFAAENVAPYMNTETEPAPQYMFAAVNGVVNAGKLSFDARMAEDLAPYVAGKEFVFRGKEIAE
ncbi:MAG: hypothetical protein IKJ71_05760 [Bacteroidaceae bacterium]|nr:hypothetical protein [Bacteroidaceae bacterium]